MQPRFARLLFASVLLGLPLAAAPGQAGEFRRFPEHGAQPASDESQIEELKELLRQAQQLQEGQQRPQQAAQEKAKSAGRGAEASPPAKADDAEKLAEGGSQKAEGEDAAQKNEEKAEEEEEPKDLARPGCMYRGTTLIWEKVPGTCKK